MEHTIDKAMNEFIDEAINKGSVYLIEGTNGFSNAGTFPTVTDVDGKGKVAMIYYSEKETAEKYLKNPGLYDNLVIVEYSIEEWMRLLEENQEFHMLVGFNWVELKEVPLYRPEDVLEMVDKKE